jgi:hypothetical protein
MSSKVNWPPEIQKRIKELRIKYNIGGTETPADAVRRGGPELPKLKEASEDHEHSMARSEIHQIDNAVKKIRKKLKGEGNLEAWVQSKITRAADYLNAASNYLESGEHGEIEESSCGDDTPEMRSRTVTSMSSSGSGRKPRKSPGELMRMLNQGEPPKKKKKKKKVTSESYLGEREMSPEEMEKEENLKGKYDDSEMKANMIAKYGKEKGTQIYFATIRKQAMKDGGDETVSEMKVRQYKKDPMEILSKLLRDIRLNRDVKQTRKGMQDTEKNIPRRLLSASFSPEELDEAKLSRTERRVRNAGRREKTTVHAYDVDETLFSHGKKGKPNVQVHVNDPSGKRVQSLSNQEFNTHKLSPGNKYDFGEFRSAKKFTQTAGSNKKVIAGLKRQQRRGKNIHLITARSKFDNPAEFQSHLRKHGIKVPTSNIHYTGGMKGGDIGDKKVTVARAVAKQSGAKKVHMYDDAAKVGRAFKAANRETPSSMRMKPHMVKPDEKGVSRSRPFKEYINYEELYTYLLESLVEMGYASDYDDASDILEEFDDETFVDVLSEAITAVAAPGDEGERRIKKGPPKKLSGYKSPYPKGVKKKYQEQVELTPYDYWKSQLINEDEFPEEIEDIQENDEPMTSYDFWKAYLELMEDARGRKPSQIRKTIVLKHLLAKKEQKAKTTQGAAVKNG